jgi:ADP-ribose pyrophosphatase YjhB (NUDIX family)
MKEERIYAALIAVGLIKNPRGEVLLVERWNQWTLPTGHMEAIDVDLEGTLVREMEEELGLESLTVVESLGTIVRNMDSSKVKSMEIFSCNIQREKEIKFYDEKEGKKKIWIRPSQALELANLDKLARVALERYLEKYPRALKKKEENRTRKNSEKIRAAY